MKPPITLMPYPNKLHVGDLANGPDELRALVQKYIGTPREVIVGGNAAADAWEATERRNMILTLALEGSRMRLKAAMTAIRQGRKALSMPWLNSMEESQMAIDLFDAALAGEEKP
jgi:hypothetical protein